MKRSILAVLAMSFLLSACGSSPAIRHYVLQPSVLQSTISESSHSWNGAVGVGPVSVAKYLRPQAVITSADGFTLESASLDQWGEPLADGIARVVADNLVVLTGSDKIRVFPWRSDEQPDIALKIEVLNLNASGGIAVMRLRWALRRTTETQPLAEGYSNYQQSLDSPAYGDIARAYSLLLAQFCTEMAEKLSGLTVAVVRNSQ